MHYNYQINGVTPVICIIFTFIIPHIHPKLTDNRNNIVLFTGIQDCLKLLF
ncbi:hypothetical protein [Adhaeribacter pallidiroseus]|uniref:hypothetical protein n=1 Tax=Adhaeribacter pallidiroseus TaxID=2072847 RepID=UPI001313FA94|nr:hypothetical protein [Adhaeribacter pallidiroseus]